MLLLIRLFSFVNLSLALLFVSAWLAFSSLNFFREEEAPSPPLFVERKELPRNPFGEELQGQDFACGGLMLNQVPPSLELPSLREECIYFGKNERPDARGSGHFYLGFRSSGSGKLVQKRRPIFLRYQEDSIKGKYFFSKEESNLWIELDEENANSIRVRLHLKDEGGKAVLQPEENQSFVLPKEENGARAAFEIGGIRVDGMLFFRQKARLVGQDRFLECHGGDEFSDFVGRERIDFTDGDGIYSCYVKEGDFLIWDDKWERREIGEKTTPYPLLHILKVDDKTLHAEIWDIEGKSRINLNLIRVPFHETLPDMEKELKFIGAKTWAQFLVDCRGERLSLRLNDWLLLTEEGWEKISTPEMLDDYVERRRIGALFVLDKWEKREGKQVLLGHLFNRDRTEMIDVVLPVFSGEREPTGHMQDASDSEYDYEFDDEDFD